MFELLNFLTMLEQCIFCYDHYFLKFKEIDALIIFNLIFVTNTTFLISSVASQIPFPL